MAARKPAICEDIEKLSGRFAERARHFHRPFSFTSLFLAIAFHRTDKNILAVQAFNDQALKLNIASLRVKEGRHHEALAMVTEVSDMIRPLRGRENKALALETTQLRHKLADRERLLKPRRS